MERRTLRQAQQHINDGNLVGLDALLKHHSAKLQGKGWAMTHIAIDNNDYKCLELIIPICDNSAIGKAIERSTHKASEDCFKLLTHHAGQVEAEYLERSLFNAISNSNELMTRFIAPLVDCRAEDSLPLMIAAEKGFYNGIVILLPFSDPAAKGHRATRAAAKNGFYEIAKLISKGHSISDIINIAKERGEFHDKTRSVLERLALEEKSEAANLDDRKKRQSV